MIHALGAAALLFGAAPTSLPPGHPAVGNPSDASMAPPLTDAQQQAGALPPGHPALPGGATAQQAPSSQELMQQLDRMKGLKDQDKPFDVASAVGKLYYANGRFEDSLLFFRQALAKTESIRALYLEQAKKAHGKTLPDAASVGCTRAADGNVKALVEKANALAKAGKAAAAASCAKEALAPVLEAQTLLGNALFLTGDTNGALTEHAAVLAVAPDDAESLYSHAGETFDSAGDDVAKLKVAKTEFARYLAHHGSEARAVQAKALLARTDEAIAAGGFSKLPHKRLTGALPTPAQGPMQGPMMAQGPMAGGGQAPFAGGGQAPFAGGGQGAPPPLSQDTIDAIQNTQRTPEMMEGMKKLMDEGEAALAAGKFQDALENYKRVVPFMPESGRAKAGMAWALVGMNRQPMADRVWQVAVNADPAAVDKLGDALKAKGDAAGAKALWTKLAQTAPAYASQSGLQGKL